MVNESLNKKFPDLSPHYRKELVRIYRGHADHANRIVSDSNKTLVNWIFILNTGALTATIYYIQQKEQLQYNLFIVSIVLFILGIISIYFSIYFEKKKFEEKGLYLDKEFIKLQNTEVTGKDFLANLYTVKEVNLPQHLESLSAALFLIGVFYSLIILFVLTPCY